MLTVPADWGLVPDFFIFLLLVMVPHADTVIVSTVWVTELCPAGTLQIPVIYCKVRKEKKRKMNMFGDCVCVCVCV